MNFFLQIADVLVLCSGVSPTTFCCCCFLNIIYSTNIIIVCFLFFNSFENELLHLYTTLCGEGGGKGICGLCDC